MNNSPIPHPAAFILVSRATPIPDSLLASIRSLAQTAESLGRLHPEQLSIIVEQRWFKAYVPAAYGGLALSLPEGLALSESLALADGSMGWTATLCSGANWFVGFLQPALADTLFNRPDACLAGSGRPSGIARRIVMETLNGVVNGYEISGAWKYATGAPHATAFTANCRIEENGRLLQNADGSPLVQAFVFLRDEVAIIEDWHTIGMIATASHSFEVDRLQVPEDRTFAIDPAKALLPGPIYRFPFLQFAEATLAVNYAGMAARFIALAQTNPAPDTLGLAVQAADRLQEYRQAFYASVTLAWEPCRLGQSIPPSALDELSHTSRALATGARRLVDELYPHCGLRAADPATEMSRVWRDLHTASQHSLFTRDDPKS